FIIDMLDGDNSRHLDVGYGQVTEVGDISYVDGEAISYELTISCDPDDNGDTLIERVAVDAGGDGEGDSGNVCSPESLAFRGLVRSRMIAPRWRGYSYLRGLAPATGSILHEPAHTDVKGVSANG